MKNILITGANGFLGKSLVEAFLKSTDNQLILIARDTDTLRQWEEEKRVFCYSVDDLYNSRVDVKSVNVILHCAFARSNDYYNLYKSIVFSNDVFNMAFRDSIPVINISSRSVYGQNPDIPWTENSVVHPNEPYALAKAVAELLIDKSSSGQKDMHYSNLRISGLIGVDFSQRFVNKLVRQAITERAISISAGSQQFTFLDIRDAADAIVALCKVPPHQWKILYNVGHTKSCGIIEIAEMVSEVALDFGLPSVDVNITKTDDILYTELDSSLFYGDTGWKPKHSLRESIRDIFIYQMKLENTNV